MAGEESEANLGAESQPFVKAFQCSQCGSSVKITALGVSLVAVCSHCGTAVDATDENFKVITRFKQRANRELAIPIGTRGKLNGTLWEVIGYMERFDTHSYYWGEYLLFNPRKGFIWLMENAGHWSLVKTIKEKPIFDESYSKTIHYNLKNYRLFHVGVAKVNYVIGEFYWRVKVGDKSEVQDYIAPPEILSFEKYQDEIQWSLAEYIDRKIIKEAFEIKTLPATTDVAPNQPWDPKKRVEKIGKIWFSLLVLLAVIQFISVKKADNKTVLDQEWIHTKSTSTAGENTFISQEFNLSKAFANIEITLHSPLENNWFFTEVELVNNDTGDSKTYELGAEFYRGYEDGESWSEGSSTVSSLVPQVPGGNYHIIVKSQTDVSSPQQPFKVTIKRDVTTWSDFIWASIWISVFPLLVFWRRRKFEMRRWSESDLSPYISHGSSEED